MINSLVIPKSGIRSLQTLFALPLALAAIFSITTTPASAANRNWSGLGTDANWLTAGNWDVVPTNGDALFFTGLSQLNNTNNFINLTNAAIAFTNNPGAFTLNGNGLTLTGPVANYGTNLETVNLSVLNLGNVTWSPNNNGGNIVMNGVINNANGTAYRTYLGGNGGMLTLTSSNNMTGQVQTGNAANQNGGLPGVNVGAGVLKLDFSAAGAPATNILWNGRTLTTSMNTEMSGGKLLMQGGAGVANRQVINQGVFHVGHSTVQVVPGAGGSAVLAYGAVNGNGGANDRRVATVDFQLPSGTQSSINGITTSQTNGLTGLLQSGDNEAIFVVNGGMSWASSIQSPDNVNSTNIIGLPNASYYTSDYNTAGMNIDVLTDGTMTAAPATIRFNQNAARILTVSGTLSTPAAGGDAILVTPNVGANLTVITNIGGVGGFKGALRAWIIHNFNTNGNLEVDAQILDNSGIQMSVTGPGKTFLHGTNTWSNTGGIMISGGSVVSVQQNENLGSVSVNGIAVNLNNATLQATAGFVMANGANSRPVVLGNQGGTIDVTGTNTLEIVGVVQGQNLGYGLSGGLTKIGTGNLKLDAASTYAGSTLVNAGTLIIAAAPSAAAAGDITVNDNAALTDAGSVSIKPTVLTLGTSLGCTNSFTGINSTTVAPIACQTLKANGTITINASGSLAVGTYPLISYVTKTGTANFVVGTLPLGVAGSIVINNGTNIALSVTSTGSADVWKGNVNNNWNIATTANWFINNAITYNDGDLVQFDDTASLFNVNVTTNVAPGSTTVNNSANNYFWSGTNNVGGTGVLTKKGSQALTIGINYTASGGIAVNAGTLIIGDGTSNGTVTASAIVNNSSIIFQRSDTNAAFSTGISGSGTVTQNGTNGGVLLLGGINTYAGNTVISNGDLKVNSTTAISYGPGFGNIVVQSTNSTFDVNGNALTINGLTGNGIVDETGPYAAAFTGNGLAFQIGANDTTSTFAGTLQNSAQTSPTAVSPVLSPVKIGVGTLYLTGTNLFTGTLQMNAGILNVASLSDYSDAGTPAAVPSAIGNRSSGMETANNNNIGLWFTGGLLQYTGSTPQTCDRMMRFRNNTVSGIDASGSNPSATVQFTWNDASLNFYDGGGTRTLWLTGSNTGANVFTLHVRNQGSSPTSVLKDGAGTWYLTNSVVGSESFIVGDNSGNSYTGSTTISNGLLYVSTGSGDVADGGTFGSTAGTIGGGAYTIYDGAMLGLINLNNGYRVVGQSLTNNGATTLHFANVSSTTLPVSYFPSVAINGTTTVVLDDVASVTVGNTYPLIKYGTLAGTFSLAPLPPGIYGQLTNDTSNGWIALATSSTPFVNTNPTNITTSVISNIGGGQSLVLTWPMDHTGWTLQVQTNSLSTGLSSNWVNVPGSSSVNTVTNAINPANGAVFYRLVY